MQALGLKGFHLLDDRGDPARVIYSFTLYEKTAGANRVRVQTDSFDQPFDINAGARLDLGSSAKLRTLISYLEIVAALHAWLAPLGPDELRAVEVHKRDQLTAWAVEYLGRARDKRLRPMLDASMERRYSASPGDFVTGGGLQVFHNFEPEDDARIMSVRDAFRNSVNLVFIRLMRDVVNYHLYREPESIGRILEDPADPRREAYLTRFADREGSEFMRQFYRKYQGKTAAESLDLIIGGIRPTPPRLATILRSVNPEASVEDLRALLSARLPDVILSDDAVAALHRKYAPDAFSLMDRGYIARVHPLELWLLDYLRAHPGASLTDTLRASADERQEVYGWLFRTSRRNAQDKRIANLLELGAFLEIQRGWERLGYPFASLTPSLASAVGASGDRPAALAELMGILVNDGLRYPTVIVDQIELALGTPYETRLSHAGRGGPAGTGPRDRGGRPRRPRRRGGAGHGAGIARLPPARRQGPRRGRQDGHGRSPLRDLCPGPPPHRVARRQPRGHLRLPDRRPLLRQPHCLRPGPRSRPLPIHERAACAGCSACSSRLWRRFSTRQADADKGPSASLAPSPRALNVRESTPRARASGAASQLDPSRRPSPLRARHAWSGCRFLAPSALGRPVQIRSPWRVAWRRIGWRVGLATGERRGWGCWGCSPRGRGFCGLSKPKTKVSWPLSRADKGLRVSVPRGEHPQRPRPAACLAADARRRHATPTPETTDARRG